jgi:tyrosyl-tRNA synthetase
MSVPPLDEQVAVLLRGTTFADEVGLDEGEERQEASSSASGQSLRQQMAAELKAALTRAQDEGRPLRVYQGFDPTASSLHLGHMVSALKLRQFQQFGHQAIFLIGDYTAMIGDPSGQSAERKQLTHEETLNHAAQYTEQAFHLLEEARTEVRRNGEWLSRLDFAELIRISSFFPLKQIISRRDFQQRLDRGDSLRFHECLYSLMQGYDAYALTCDVQVGGYDQHFNMLAGRIIQQRQGQRPHVMLTMPLLRGTDGRKMSKSYGNAIMLNDSPADMYGKCMRISDDLLPEYLDLATTLPPAEVDQLKETLAKQEENPKNIKKIVARNVVLQYHGDEAANEAEERFRQLSELRGAPTDVPEANLAVGSEGLWLPKALVQLELVKSSSEGRRLIKQGAVSLDGVRVTDVEQRLLPGPAVLIRVGKRRYSKVTPQ